MAATKKRQLDGEISAQAKAAANMAGGAASRMAAQNSAAPGGISSGMAARSKQRKISS